MSLDALPIFTQVQLRMDDWLKQGLLLPINDVGFDKSNQLLRHILGMHDAALSSDMNEEREQQCTIMLGPHGYTYYRTLLERAGPFIFKANKYSRLQHD